MSFNSKSVQTASGSTDEFNFTFGYLDRDHIKILVDGVEDTTFTFVDDDTVTLSSTPTVGQEVVIKRVTPRDEVLISFQNTVTTPSATNLNTMSLTTLYYIQEVWEQSLGNLDEDTVATVEGYKDAAEAAQAAAEAAQAAAEAAATLPAFTGEALSMPRVNAGETALEYRTPAEVLTAIAALPLAGGTLTGDLVLNGDPDAALKAATKQYVDNTAGAPALQKNGGTLLYIDNTTVTVKPYAYQDTTDSAILAKTSNQTLDITTFGADLGILQSANLGGTISVTSSSSNVGGSGTNFLTDFVVGDVITTAGGQSRRIITITNDTTIVCGGAGFTSTESSVTYKRGGRAPKTAYIVYTCGKAAGADPITVLTTRSVGAGQTLVDMPTDYTLYREFHGAIILDSSSNILEFVQKPNLDIIFTCHLAGYGTTVGDTNVLDGGADALFTDVNLWAFLPKNSRLVRLKIASVGNNSGSSNWRANGVSHDGLELRDTATGSVLNLYEALWEVPTDENQVIEYKNTGDALDAAVAGFTVTEAS